jgi:hypothetical protein
MRQKKKASIQSTNFKHTILTADFIKKYFIVLSLLAFSCDSYRYTVIYDKSELTEDVILDRAIKEEEHILTIVFTKSMNYSEISIRSESLDFRTFSTYYDQKLENCPDKYCMTIKVNNRTDISLKINNEKIELHHGISNNYKFLIVDKSAKGIKLKYTNYL